MDPISLMRRTQRTVRRRAGWHPVAGGTLAATLATLCPACGGSPTSSVTTHPALVQPAAVVPPTSADHLDETSVPAWPVLTPSTMEQCRRDIDQFTDHELYTFSFEGSVEGTRYFVWWALDPYHGPGEYTVRGLRSDFTGLAVSYPGGDILGLGRGTITPAAPNGRSGMLDVDVTLPSGAHLKVAGPWQCGGAI